MGSEAIGSGATDNTPMPLGTAASSTHDDTARTGSGSLKDQNQILFHISQAMGKLSHNNFSKYFLICK